MNTLIKPLLPLLFSTAFLSPLAFAAPTLVSGGTIHFVGQIVEDPCTVTTAGSEIGMNCLRDGQSVRTTMPVATMTAGEVMSNNVANVSMRFINPQQTLALVTVVYK